MFGKFWNFIGIKKDTQGSNKMLCDIQTTNNEPDKALMIQPFGFVVRIPIEGTKLFVIENNGNSSSSIVIGGTYEKALTLDDDEYAYLPKDGKKIISIKNNGDVNIDGGDINIKGSKINIDGSDIILGSSVKIGSSANLTPITDKDILQFTGTIANQPATGTIKSQAPLQCKNLKIS